MSIATRIESIEDHIRDIYDTLEIAGSDLTDVDKNIVNINVELIDRLIYYINNGIDTVITNWPKATGSGSSITLNDTIVAPLQDLKLNPSELVQDGTPSPSTPQTVHSISGNNTISISDGTDATSYSITLGNVEYCKIGDYADDIKKSTGANLVNAEDFVNKAPSYTKISENIYDFTTGGTFYSKGLKVNIKPPFTCTLKIKNGTGNGFRIRFIWEDGTASSGQNSESGTDEVTLTNTFTYLESRGNLVEIRGDWVTSGTFTMRDFMINYGTTGQPYEPYGTSWYIKKEKGKVVLDGSEYWVKETQSNNTNFRTALSTALGGDTTITCKSNYFIGVTGNQSYQGNIDNGIGIGSSKNLRIRSSYFETYDTNAFKTWLETNKPILYYVLNTPTYTILSNTLQTELDNLFNAKSKDNQTIITQTNNDLPFIIDVKALTKLGDDE